MKPQKTNEEVLYELMVQSLDIEDSSTKTVVEEVINPAKEISLEDARQLAGNEVELGDCLILPSQNK